MTLQDLLTIAVIVVAVPLNWYVAVILAIHARLSPEVVLRVQAVAWVSLSIIVTVFAAVFVNNGMNEPILDVGATQILTRSTLLVCSVVPAVYWLRTVWRK